MSKYGNRYEWTEELKDKLKIEYGSYGSAGRFSTANGISIHSVYKMANSMGLKLIPKGTYVGNHGYLVYRKMTDRVTEHYLVHRHMMEEHLGRKLLSTELVHHKDEDKLHNEIGNFEILTRAEHLNHHRSTMI